MSATYPLTLGQFWELIQLHAQHEREIHPAVQAYKVTSLGENSIILERDTLVEGKLLHSAWKYSMHPPFDMEGEVLEGEFMFGKGSKWVNSYEEREEGRSVRITTRGVFNVLNARDEKEAREIVESWGTRTDNQDLDFWTKWK